MTARVLLGPIQVPDDDPPARPIRRVIRAAKALAVRHPGVDFVDDGVPRRAANACEIIARIPALDGLHSVAVGLSAVPLPSGRPTSRNHIASAECGILASSSLIRLTRSSWEIRKVSASTSVIRVDGPDQPAGVDGGRSPAAAVRISR
jgi:hypothetical protein